jgi:hypothetical protein
MNVGHTFQLTNLGGSYAHWLATFRLCGCESLGKATCHLARHMLPAKMWLQPYSAKAMDKRERVDDDYFKWEVDIYLTQTTDNLANVLRRCEHDGPARIMMTVPVDLATSNVAPPSKEDFALGEWLRHFHRPTVQSTAAYGLFTQLTKVSPATSSELVEIICKELLLDELTTKELQSAVDSFR